MITFQNTWGREVYNDQSFYLKIGLELSVGSSCETVTKKLNKYFPYGLFQYYDKKCEQFYIYI